VKALIIILALVGGSFIGLLIYGEGRSPEPKRACQQIKKDGDDWTVPDDWCPPGVAKSTRWLQAKFAPGLDLPKPGKVMRETNVQQDVFFDVPAIADTDKHRAAKLTLVDGNYAIVKGPDHAIVCLCEPKSSLAGPLLDGTCGVNWQRDHAKSGPICQPADKGGTIPVEWSGARLTFTHGPSAKIEVK